MQTEVAELLIDIESELRTLGLWSQVPPSAQALASDQPFCVDTLTLSQWLQHVFLPTLYQVMEDGQQLPQRCSVAPMAQEYFKGSELATGPLLAALLQIDITLSAEAE